MPRCRCCRSRTAASRTPVAAECDATVATRCLDAAAAGGRAAAGRTPVAASVTLPSRPDASMPLLPEVEPPLPDARRCRGVTLPSRPDASMPLVPPSLPRSGASVAAGCCAAIGGSAVGAGVGLAVGTDAAHTAITTGVMPPGTGIGRTPGSVPLPQGK